MNSYYTLEELNGLGFKSFGENVLISRKASIYGPEKMSIGSNVRIDDFCILSGNITLQNYIHIAAYCAFFGGNSGIIMEDYTGISSRGAIYAESDDYSGVAFTNPMLPDQFRSIIRGQVIIQKHAIIGTGTSILPGVIIKEGAAVGSMSLVNKSLDEWGIYAGIPCRKINERNKKLLELEQEFIDSLDCDED